MEHYWIGKDDKLYANKLISSNVNANPVNGRAKQNRTHNWSRWRIRYLLTKCFQSQSLEKRKRGYLLNGIALFRTLDVCRKQRGYGWQLQKKINKSQATPRRYLSRFIKKSAANHEHLK